MVSTVNKRFRMNESSHYYVPPKSYWPIVGAIGLFAMVLGGVNLLHGHPIGIYLFLTGSLLVAVMMFGWFSNVIHESQAGLYSPQLDRTFRLSMLWFIFSEVMFFAAFFG